MSHKILPSGTIYTTLSSHVLREKIEEIVKSIQPNFTFQHFNNNATSSLDIIKHWQQHKGDVPDQPVTFSYSCYITDQNRSQENDGAVIYALFEKKIPTIRFLSIREDEVTFTNPLLQVYTMTSDDDAVVLADQAPKNLTNYFSFPKEGGKVIVIEGGDGAGKQTQTGLLIKKLESIGKKVATVDYPHDAARYGVLIREVLKGHKGPLKEVSPLVFGALYGLNRHDHKSEIDNWLLHGYVLVFDRWTTANYGHQASKFKTNEERDDAIQALRNFEVKWLGLPDADRVFYLDLPPVVAYNAMLADASRKELDLHEKAGLEYKDNVRRAFIWCCERFKETWNHVPCWDETKEERVSREGVHENIWKNCESLF